MRIGRCALSWRGRVRTRACSTWWVAFAMVLAGGNATAKEPIAVDDEDSGGTVDLAELDDEPLGPSSNLRTRAEEVSFDARQRTLELAGNVRVDAPPFHLRSQRIRLTRTKLGVELVGRGSLAFCPCLGTPLKVDFDEALVAPPGDLILKNPTLRVYDVPVLPLPYFWLRSDDKVGLLPPDLAYRGHDGVFAGGGLHVPWKAGGEKHWIDVRSGAYVLRGFVVDVRLRTPSSNAKIRYDRLPGARGDDGLSVDARGSTTTTDAVGVAWDVDLLRGARGLRATTELDAASRPWDRATAEAALRGAGVVVATAVRGVTRRGAGLGDVEAFGPVTSVRASGNAGAALTYDMTVEGGVFRVQSFAPGVLSRDALSFARAEGGVRGATSLGPFEASLSVRGAGNVAAAGGDRDDARAGSARARVSVPLAKTFERGTAVTTVAVAARVPDAGANANAGVNAKAGAKADADAKAGAKADANASADADVKADADAGVNANADALVGESAGGSADTKRGRAAASVRGDASGANANVRGGPAAEGDNDPWIHVVEPFAEAALVSARDGGLLGLSPAGAASGMAGTAPIADAGITTTLGQWGSRRTFELVAAVGAAFGDAASRARPLARARLAASLAWIGASAETAHVLDDATIVASGARVVGAGHGSASVARLRLGAADSVRLLLNVAMRDGVDPVLARALFDAPLEPASGFLMREGTTGGAGVVVPWARAVTTSAGIDADASQREVVAARGGVELRDRCGCLTLRLMASHRLGRDGIDAWLALDFAVSR